MLFDSHCHLNFNIFANQEEKIVLQAKANQVDLLVVPGTEYESSKKAVDLACQFDLVYAAVGIHPHHVYKLKEDKERLKVEMLKIENLLKNKKVVAVGEIGLDRYVYQKTKYENYQISNEFINLQKEVFLAQLKLAKKHKKAVIIHNRQATDDLVTLLKENYHWRPKKMVFHCCQPDDQLLDFAIKNKIFIGVDGDVVYNQKKQAFVKKVPLALLVLETDSPFLSPNHQFPNQPANLKFIAEFVADLYKVDYQTLAKTTTKNSNNLFNLS